jgi:hypothetical protein
MSSSGVRWPVARISRRVALAEDPHLVQQPVEQRRADAARAVDLRLGVQKLQHVADGDVGQRAALGRDDHGASVQRQAAHRWRDVGAGAQRAQPREPLRVPAASHAPREGALGGRADHQPGQRGPHNIGADRQHQGCGQGGLPRRGDAVAHHPPSRHLTPAPAGGVGSAGEPPLLPAAARLVGQPAQQRLQPAAVDPLATIVVRDERRPGQQPPHLFARVPGGGPVRRVGARGKPDPGRLPPGRRHRRWWWCGVNARAGPWQDVRRCADGGHHTPAPNRTSSVSGR